MRGQPGRLSPLKLRQVAKVEGFHADGGGLYLQVTRNKNHGHLRASWVFLFVLRGHRHAIGGGSMHTISLAMAREWALEQRRLLQRGLDPLASKRGAEQAAAAASIRGLSFDEVRDKYFAEHESKWRSASHRREWRSSLERYCTPVFGKTPVAMVDRALVIRALEPVWKQHPETASRIRGRIETILNFAAVSGLREGENAASWDLLKHKFPNRKAVAPTEHMASMDYRDVPALVAELQQRTEVAAAALLFGILTATRGQEFRGAKFDEFNLDEKVWEVPAARMKSHRPHRIPLSDATMDVLTRMAAIRTNEFVFFGQKGHIQKDAVRRLLADRLGHGDVVPHGFRSSMSTWRAERTSFDAETMEAALAHILSDKVMAAYQRGKLFEKRAVLMQAWGAYCAGKPADVVALRPVAVS
jgi:integrase